MMKLRSTIMGAVLCASGAQTHWPEMLRVLEAVASTRMPAYILWYVHSCLLRVDQSTLSTYLLETL